MVALALQAGYAGTWVGSLSGPSRLVGRPIQCSRLAPQPRRSSFKPVSQFLAGSRRSVLEFPSARRFGCDQLTRQLPSRVSASAGKDEPTPDSGSIPLDPSVFEGETYQNAKDAYTQKEGREAFKDCEELFPVYESQHVLGNGKINLPDGPVLVPEEENPVDIWDVVKRAPKIIAAAIVTGILLFNTSGPAKAPTVRETAAYRTPVRTPDRTAVPRRGRNTARNVTQQKDESIPLVLPGAILACAAFAVVLLKNKSSKPKEDPFVTVVRLNLAVLGTATSLRMDLEDTVGKQQKDFGDNSKLNPGVKPKSLNATAQALLKNLEHIAFARKRLEHALGPRVAITMMQGFEHADFKHSNHVGMHDMLTTIRKEYGHKVVIQEDPPFVDYYKAGYTVVTLTCALKGRLHLPDGKDTDNLRTWLRKMEVFDSKDVVEMRLKWGPTEGETMPEETMHKHYPEMKLLAREEDLAELERVSA